MSYKLFLDDVRNPINCSSYMHRRIGARNVIYTENDWIVVRNYDEFCDYINKNGCPVLVSFDHDLSDEHYDVDKMNSSAEYDTLYQTFTEKTGLECAKFLIDFCDYHNISLPEIIVHSMNPVGRKNIENLVVSYKKFKENA